MKVSVLDLVPVIEGGSIGQALHGAAALARTAEQAGYTRYWVAEHHGMEGIAGAATSVVLSHIGAATRTIRIGAGGIMLPNHNPLVIAEQFGTLDALYPGRIDLGLGRAPGADQRIVHALRKDVNRAADHFPQDVVELRALFAGDPRLSLQATPGKGAAVEMWVLGSSLFGAQLAAMLGLPYAFASHFAPEALMQALEVYRTHFRPSEQLDKPYVMVGMNVVAAETDAEAKRLFTSAQQGFTNLLRGTRGQLSPPIDDIDSYWSPAEKAQASRMLRYAMVGDAATIREGIAQFAKDTKADEFMATGMIYDHAARLTSYEILSEVARTF